MNNQNPFISVILPVYNRGFMLEMVLKSLLNQTYDDYEIVLVDDGSTDNTAEIAARFPEVRYFYRDSHSDKSSSATRNKAIRESKGEVLYFTDSDVICPPNLLETHAYWHNKHPKIIVQSQLVRIINLNDAYTEPYSKLHYSRAYFDTAAVSVRRKWFDKAGGFDSKTLPHGWEDLELGLRMTKLKLKVKRLNNKAYVWHYEGDYSKECIHKYFEKRVREGEQGLNFYRKHPTFEVKMMVMVSPFFFWLGKHLYNEKYLKSDAFYNKVLRLIKKGKKARAIAMVRVNGYCFYLKGLEKRIKREKVKTDDKEKE